MIYVVGDLHGDLSKIKKLHDDKKLSKSDTVILLGDTGLSSTYEMFATSLKKQLSAIPTNFLCVRGEFDALNYTTYTESERWHLHITEGKIHDNSYKQKIWNCGKGDYEEAYPNILYANDGEIFVIEDKAILTIGGACMQNKQWRSDIFGIEFIPDKPQKVVKDKAKFNLEQYGWKVDYVVTHTCPYEYRPTYRYIPDLNTAKCFKRHYDNEKFLSKIRNKLVYEMWLCGHFHLDRTVGNVRFLYDDIYEIK